MIKNNTTDNYSICRLCGKKTKLCDMSEEHYPARSTGNKDIVQVDIVKAIETFQSPEILHKIKAESERVGSIREAAEKYFDEELACDLYPKGRTARTLCRKCNTFLGKYDEAYLKFFNANGSPKIIKGFQKRTKVQIVKSIYGKFLSVPEAKNENYDFIDFIKDDKIEEYRGKWHLYFVKRDLSSDIMGFKDIRTGKLIFKEGVVYELSDERFIFDLMDFEKHSCYPMNNIFDIFKNDYSLIQGTGEHGGYHAQILMSSLYNELLSSTDDDK